MKLNIKDKISNIEDKINKRRKKKDITKGNIIYIKDGEKNNTFGITISDEEYVTLYDSKINSKVIVEKITPISEYYVAVVDDKNYINENLAKIAASKEGDQNILNRKYNNTFHFIVRLLEEASNRKYFLKKYDFDNLKEFLLTTFKINKWRSTYTQLSILQKEKEIKEKKNEFSKKNKNNLDVYKKKLKSKLENVLNNGANENFDKDVNADKLNALKEKIKNLKNKIVGKNLNSVMNNEAEIAGLHQKIQNVSSNNEEIEVNLSSLEEKLREIKEFDREDLEKLKGIVSSLKNEENVEKEKLDELKDSIKEKISKLNDEKLKSENLENKGIEELEELVDKIKNSTDEKNKKLEEDLEKLKEKEALKAEVLKLLNELDLPNNNVIDEKKYNDEVIKAIKEKNENRLEELSVEKESLLELESILNTIYTLYHEKELEKDRIEKLDIQESEGLISNLKEIQNEINNADEEEMEKYFNSLNSLMSLSKEINNENIQEGSSIIKIINALSKSKDNYEKNKELMKGWGFSLNELKSLPSDFFYYLKFFEDNSKLKKVIDKIGRKEKKEESISMEIKNEKLINEYFKEELSGITISNDLSRVLPSELIYLLDENTENIFYTKLLESTLLCYKMQGDDFAKKEEERKKEQIQEEKGAIIALVDTSGSMGGSRIDKARAILVKTLQIAKKDKRDMKVILFGSYGQTQEYTVDSKYSIEPFINFISNAYNGGTDVEYPLNNAIEIVTTDKKYTYADIFMLTDGEFGISSNLSEKIKISKKKLNLKIYTVLLDSYGGNSISYYCDEVINC